MKARKLFWEDAYIREFDATVVSISDGKIVLDQTAFNPKGGGLVGDTGYINDIRVLDTNKEDETIIHHVESTDDLKPGDRVRGRLDWDRRHRIMRMHTTAHILSAIFHGQAKALITGNEIDPERSRIDFSIEGFDKEIMQQYVALANESVKRNLEVKSYFMSKDEALKVPDIVKLAQAAPPDVAELRIVEILGLDRQADGGPHVKNTGEIGTINVLKFENKGKTNRRMYFTVVP